MQVDKNTQWGLLSNSYDTQKQSATTQNPFINTLEKTNSLDKTDGISSLFDIGQNVSVDSGILDSFSLSNELQKVQNFAKNFSGDLGNLGQEMQRSGILNAEEKMGFDVINKFNPSLDSAKTQEMLKNSNLSQQSTELLNNVDKKIAMVRYFGGF
ncbi:MAG: hypothetical protein SOW25_00780 [Helicobacter sp.]|nr:hypothetical protein [Helicobacteraceae bacterium]MDY3112847.1 hypothetical protein [Helicobacter sp.]